MKKRSIFEAIINRFKQKPVTPEEIEQLRMEAIKFRLKADIAKSKATIRNSKSGSSNALRDLFGDNKNPEKSFDYKQDESKEKKNLRRRTLGY